MHSPHVKGCNSTGETSVYNEMDDEAGNIEILAQPWWDPTVKQATDYVSALPGGAGGEDVVLSEHQRVAQYLHELLVQEAHVARAEEPDVLGPARLDGDQLLQAVP